MLKAESIHSHITFTSTYKNSYICKNKMAKQIKNWSVHVGINTEFKSLVMTSSPG